jgi:Domain of unknown function (DUF1835)
MERAQIHIVNGDSAAGTLLVAIGCDRESILVQHDPLSVGPLPRLESLDEWRALREEFWDRIDAGIRTADNKRDLLSHADQLRSCEAITVWVGGGASDQLLLPWVVHLFTLIDAPMCRMSVVQIERLPPNGSYIAGLGELSPEQLRAHAHPRPLSGDEIAELEAYWSALTAPRPDELLRSIGRDATAFQLVRRALRTTLDRFPDLRTGLSHWDQELLGHVKSQGRRAVMVIAHTLINSYETDYPDSVGDVYLFGRLRQLADRRLAQPAVVMEGDLSSYRGCEVRLTAAGEAFLEGSKNFAEVNGVDEWVAGVHLDSRAHQVWFRNGETLVAGSAV